MNKKPEAILTEIKRGFVTITKHITSLKSKVGNRLEEIPENKKKYYTLGGSAASFVLIMAILYAMLPDADQAKVPDKIADNLPVAPVEETVTQIFAIDVNGADILYVASEEEANAVLDGVTAKYQTPGSELTNFGFSEDVAIVKKETSLPTVLLTVDEAVDYILTGTTAPKTYIVKGGDNLWDIAAANNISPYELQAMNPGFDPKDLFIGQELNLYETHPFMTVHSTEVVTTEERIAYETKFEDTTSLYKGQTQVKTAGSYGNKQIKAEVVKENGVVVASNILSETVTQQPVTQVALRGTAATPVYTGSGSGTLSSPVAHIEVSSAFGSRGGGRHHGVDLRDPKGTPIMAAADGVVTQANYSGSFGNVIKISHGGGLETLYAHCDTINVSVGDTVARGQQIGTVGITGNATGYHLHFEVRLNGAQQNPMNYI